MRVEVVLFIFHFFILAFWFIAPMVTCVGFYSLSLRFFLVNNVFPLKPIELVSLEIFWNRMEFWVVKLRVMVSHSISNLDWLLCRHGVYRVRFLHLWEEGRGWWAVPPLVPEFSSLRARRLLANEGHGPADARGKRVQHRLSHRLSYNRSIDFCNLLRSLVKNLKTC